MTLTTIPVAQTHKMVAPIVGTLEKTSLNTLKTTLFMSPPTFIVLYDSVYTPREVGEKKYNSITLCTFSIRC